MINPMFNAMRYAGFPVGVGPSPIGGFESGPPLFEPMGPKPWEPFREGFSRNVREEITPVAERVLLRAMPTEIGLTPRTRQEQEFNPLIVDYIRLNENRRLDTDFLREARLKRYEEVPGLSTLAWDASSCIFFQSEAPRKAERRTFYERYLYWDR